MGAGVSLFSHSSSEQVTQKEVSFPSLLNPSASVKEHGVAISRRDLSLTIGDLTLKVIDKGQEFISGMYLAVLGENGNVVDAIYADDYANLAKNLNGTLSITMST